MQFAHHMEAIDSSPFKWSLSRIYRNFRPWFLRRRPKQGKSQRNSWSTEFRCPSSCFRQLHPCLTRQLNGIAPPGQEGWYGVPGWRFNFHIGDARVCGWAYPACDHWTL